MPHVLLGRQGKCDELLFDSLGKFLHKRKKAISFEMAFRNNAGDHLISHTVSRAVPSAQRGLTSVFGMGTGDPSQYGHRQTEALCGRLEPAAEVLSVREGSRRLSVSRLTEIPKDLQLAFDF